MIIVSVIIPTYNSEDSIRRTLDSVFGQEGNGTEFQLEVLVVDDCSKDKTVEILKEYEVRLFEQEENKGGPNYGRNIGLKNATGAYICFIDHDDEWTLDKIKAQLAVADQAPVISSAYTLIEEAKDRTEVRGSSAGGSVRYAKNETFLKLLSREKKGRQTFYFSNIMISAKLKHILFEERFGMVDYDWLLRVFEGNASIEIQKSLMIRYVEGANLSLNETYRRNDFFFSLLNLDAYYDQYPKHVRKGIKRLYGTRGRYYYFIGDMHKARRSFIRAELSVKMILYYLTSFWGHKFVKRKFNTFV